MTTGEIVYRPPEGSRHECDPPLRCAVYKSTGHEEQGWAPKFSHWQPCTGSHYGYGCINGEAAEPLGTVWRCSECGRYWVAYLPQNHPASRLMVEYKPTWRPATWLERHRARRAARAER